ncbi:unnamed protein product [Strongylus vulgaris]|uniref:Uncharacterized protein n=1 Tax=Strongylus vulgaris TaxID=40348 RepID=A0A3P7L9L4_STRVU|nr:unnamed protein product [Strongylus vulgaris]
MLPGEVYPSSWRVGDSGVELRGTAEAYPLAEKKFGVAGSLDVQLRIGHARSLNVWLIKLVDGSLFI